MKRAGGRPGQTTVGETRRSEATPGGARRSRLVRCPLATIAGMLIASSSIAPAHAAEDGFPTPPTAPQGVPNVLVIMTDDVGFASSTTFGGVIPTPSMDRLAANGLRYSNFHTTGLCSPSRAALLTGRNHHAVGSGTVTDLARGLPGYTSIIPKSAATLAQVLRANGYDTAAFGKNHNVPTWQSGPLGPFDQWMSGLGFDYFYGFHGGHTDQFAPALVENNNLIEPPARPGYIFDQDMADHAVQWLRTQRAESGGRPFFLYYAPGTAHAPLHAPPEWMAKFRGKFDEGWDMLRQRIFERQKRLGVIPAGAKLAALPPDVKPWNTLSESEKRVAARFMEAYAAALAFCDDQIGRLLTSLDQSGQLDNTLVVYIQGDNGATPEGGIHGMINYAGRFEVEGNADKALADIDKIGGPESYPVAPLGWMMAMNTPYPYHKVIASRLGGITNGMVVSWPEKISERGMRRQFTHLVDVMPTILDAAGIAPPESVNGVKQQPFDGISFTYSFADSKAPERHRKQYFEIFGNAALYQDGWFVASPIYPMGLAGNPTPADAEKWELYDLRTDSSQTTDVADKYPEKLQQMREAFDAEAQRNNVLPVSGNNLPYLLSGGRPEVTAAPGRYTFVPSSFRYARGVFPSIHNRSWTIEADIDLRGAHSDGALVTQGGKFSGWGLVLLEGIPTFLYRTSDTPDSLTRLAAPAALPPGPHRIEVRFGVDGPGLGKGGSFEMSVDDKTVASGRLDETAPIRFSEEDATVGWDSGTALTGDYRVPFKADGLRSVTVELGPVQTPFAAPAK